MVGACQDVVLQRLLLGPAGWASGAVCPSDAFQVLVSRNVADPHLRNMACCLSTDFGVADHVDELRRWRGFVDAGDSFAPT